jgi:hypothetical protein
MQCNNSPHPVPLQATTSSQRMQVSDLTASGSRNGRSQLGADFQPSLFSVICGRGKDSYDHEGNHRFRELTTMFVARYSRASSKADKSDIVSEVVNMIHQAEGTFCKFENGAWYKVENCYAREKTGALLRELVQTQQRSPAKKTSKKANKTKKTKAKPDRPVIQKQRKTQPQQNNQKLVVDGTAGHSDDYTPSQQCGEQLVEDGSISGGWGASDDSSISTWSYWRGEGCKENSLEDEDDFSDTFRMDSSLHTPLNGDAECCIVGVLPLSLFNSAAAY